MSFNRFTTNNRCPNCGSYQAAAKQHCWGLYIAEGLFLCTRAEQSINCREYDTGFLHRLGTWCWCEKSHQTDFKVIAELNNMSITKKNDSYIDNLINRIWKDSVYIEGTIGHRYLLNRKIRTIDNNALRFHPNLPHPKDKKYYPTLVAKISDSHGKMVAIQRIFLDSDVIRNGGYKFPLKPTKPQLGKSGNSAVKFGQFGQGVLGIAEGVESALTLYQELQIPVWACLGSSNFSNIQLPPLEIVDTIKLFPDGDKAGLKALIKASKNYRQQGYKVIDCQSPYIDKDYNDLLMEEMDDE